MENFNMITTGLDHDLSESMVKRTKEIMIDQLQSLNDRDQKSFYVGLDQDTLTIQKFDENQYAIRDGNHEAVIDSVQSLDLAIDDIVQRSNGFLSTNPILKEQILESVEKSLTMQFEALKEGEHKVISLGEDHDNIFVKRQNNELAMSEGQMSSIEYAENHYSPESAKTIAKQVLANTQNIYDMEVRSSKKIAQHRELGNTSYADGYVFNEKLVSQTIALGDINKLKAAGVKFSAIQDIDTKNITLTYESKYNKMVNKVITPTRPAKSPTLAR